MDTVKGFIIGRSQQDKEKKRKCFAYWKRIGDKISQEILRLRETSIHSKDLEERETICPTVIKLE